MSEPLIVRASAPKVVGLTALSLALACLSLWLAVRGTLIHHRAIGWLGLIFFGAGGILIPIKMGSGAPVIEMTDDGFIDHRLGIGLVPWSAVKSATVREIKHNRFICLDLEQPELFLGNLSPGRRAFFQVGTKMGYGHISINCVGLDKTHERVWSFVASHARNSSGA